MKLKSNSEKGSRKAWSPYTLVIKTLLIGTLSLTGIQAEVQAQDTQYTRPSWFFGIAGGANMNFYNGSTHKLNDDFTPPATFHEGQGFGLYAAPLIEFHRPNSFWGLMLQGGLDNRNGDFAEVKTPCNCPADLTTDLSYITIEPSLRIAPFKSDFYLYVGPRFAFNTTKSFTYQLGINPAFPEQELSPEVTGDFSDMNATQISMQVGAGYDIYLSSKAHQTQFVLSPFVSFQPYFGQSPRSIETWNITTVRGGIALKLGSGREIKAPVKVEETIVPEKVVVAVVPEAKFVVNAPKNVPAETKVTEIFPLRNYVFFDEGSTEIPNRYILLKKDQVKDFREDQLEATAPKSLNGRSNRQMVIYYNVLNILGDRMVKNPSTSVKLVGSSENGSEDGRKMAASVKNYLVSVFGIDASRIATEGQVKPNIPSLKEGRTNELVLLREGDRRVSIESTSPVLLMEYQKGPNAPLKSVEITNMQEAPLESYITFANTGASEAYTSWRMELKDEEGTVQNFGPYTVDTVSLPGKSIMGTRPSGDYKVKMIGTTKTDEIVEKESIVRMQNWIPAPSVQAMRFSILYEFNNSVAIPMYEKYLNDVVAPNIPNGGTVIIHGHTDIIGGEDYNQKLSSARAENVKSILEKNLKAVGRSDVKFQVNGYGEDEKTAPFDNKYPEERDYNRTVIIDVVIDK